MRKYTEEDKRIFIRAYQLRNGQYLHVKADKATRLAYVITAFVCVLTFFYSIYGLWIA